MIYEKVQDSVNSGTVTYKGTLTSADVDGLRGTSGTGYYYASGLDILGRGTSQYGILIVLGCGSVTEQFFSYVTGVYWRDYSGSPSSWTSWQALQ